MKSKDSCKILPRKPGSNDCFVIKSDQAISWSMGFDYSQTQKYTNITHLIQFMQYAALSMLWFKHNPDAKRGQRSKKFNLGLVWPQAHCKNKDSELDLAGHLEH